MNNMRQAAINIAVANYDKVHAMGTAELRDELARALTVTADNLKYLSIIWRELEYRGEDLQDLRSGLGLYLPMIASGHLAAEAVVAFAGRPKIMDMIARLPIERQLALASGERVTVVRVEPTGDVEQVEKEVFSLTVREAALVFDDGRTRLPVEQTRMLSTQMPASRVRPAVVTLKMTQDQHRKLKTEAARRGQTIVDVVISVMQEADLI